MLLGGQTNQISEVLLRAPNTLVIQHLTYNVQSTDMSCEMTGWREAGGNFICHLNLNSPVLGKQIKITINNAAHLLFAGGNGLPF